MSLELFSPLVTTEWLAKHLGHPELRLVDCRWYLTDPPKGRRAYEAGHIPGAVFVDIDTELAEHPGPGRHPLPSPARFGAVMRHIGVGPHTAVIAYDDAGGSIAARLWWLLRYFGHESVALLDGGLTRWVAEGRALDDEISEYPPGSLEPIADPGRVLHYADVADRPPGTLLIDARAVERYAGETEPIDKKAGHIPGAINLPFSGNLEAGVFKTPEALRARYLSAGVEDPSRVVVYCGSGVTACHDLLALEVAGLRGAKLYAGSWSDWSSHPDAPVATGRQTAEQV